MPKPNQGCFRAKPHLIVFVPVATNKQICSSTFSTVTVKVRYCMITNYYTNCQGEQGYVVCMVLSKADDRLLKILIISQSGVLCVPDQ